MRRTRLIGTVLQRITLLTALSALVACGGGDEELPCSQTLAVLTAGLCLIGEVTYTSESGSQSQQPPPPPPASDDSPPSPPSSDTVVMRRLVEFEPNSTLDNANPVSFRNATAEEHIGIEVTGSVTEAGDPADFFILTPPRSGQFLIYLCDQSCAETLHSDAVYLMVYDQSQSTIESTAVGSVIEQKLGVELTAGLAYYVEVNAYNSGSSRVDYRLVLID